MEKTWIINTCTENINKALYDAEKVFNSYRLKMKDFIHLHFIYGNQKISNLDIRIIHVLINDIRTKHRDCRTFSSKIYFSIDNCKDIE